MDIKVFSVALRREAPTILESPRKKRSRLRDPGDASGEQSIEDYLFRSDPTTYQDKADRYGSSLFKTDETCTNVTFFSTDDIKATALDIEEDMTQSEADLAAAREEKDMRLLAGAKVPKRLEVTIDSTSDRIRSLEAKKRIVATMPLPLGKTCLSSRKAVCDRESKIADWELVGLDQSLLGGNEPQVNRMPFIPPALQTNNRQAIGSK
ncbi:hypothetical protein N7461_007525 [Penicillium sp. DV-2018c]|nr:hypothetical protein N7461_007525 [Penicillium sp. DV-2018c]